jgi:hypothetical protein
MGEGMTITRKVFITLRHRVVSAQLRGLKQKKGRIGDQDYEQTRPNERSQAGNHEGKGR